MSRIDTEAIRRHPRRDRPGILHQLLPCARVLSDITAFEKIQLEAPYHALTNGGHITYVELDGDPTQNLEAFETVIRCMKECRHRLRLDQPSGRPRPGLRLYRHHRRRLPAMRPHGRRHGDHPFERIRRITGYLVGTLDRFNNAKAAEVHDRVTHSLGTGKGELEQI